MLKRSAKTRVDKSSIAKQDELKSEKSCSFLQQV